jgi:hypothetical protein
VKRLLAAAVAVAMVAVSLYLRDRMDDEGGAASGGKGGGRTTVVCARDLAEACRALEADGDADVTIEDAGTTYERLVAGDDVADAWLVLQPWPEMVDVGTRGSSGADRFVGGDPVLARSPLVLVTVVDRRGTEPCVEADAGWGCLGEAARAGARIGWPDPASTASGRLALGAATVGFFGTSAVSTNDFAGEFELWRADVLEAAGPQPDPTRTLLVNPAAFQLGVTTEAAHALATREATERNVSRLRFLYPEPVVTADVVLAAIDGSDLPEDLVAGARDALLERGWRGPGGRGAPDDAPPLPDGTNLPSAGVLVALGEAVRR